MWPLLLSKLVSVALVTNIHPHTHTHNVYSFVINDIFYIFDQFLADRTNGRAIVTLLRLSTSYVVVCL